MQLRSGSTVGRKPACGLATLVVALGLLGPAACVEEESPETTIEIVGSDDGKFDTAWGKRVKWEATGESFIEGTQSRGNVEILAVTDEWVEAEGEVLRIPVGPGESFEVEVDALGVVSEVSEEFRFTLLARERDDLHAKWGSFTITIGGFLFGTPVSWWERLEYRTATNTLVYETDINGDEIADEGLFDFDEYELAVFALPVDDWLGLEGTHDYEYFHSCDDDACVLPKRQPVADRCARSSEDACEADEDCVAGGCGGELCYNPDIGAGISTCECAEPVTAGCGCVEGQCSWWR